MRDSFFADLEKRAVSMGRTLAALHARVSQGARVAPAILQGVQAQSHLTSTPANVRRLALGAADAMTQKRQMFNRLAEPSTAAARARIYAGYEAAQTNAPGTFSHQRLYLHDDPTRHAYSQAHLDRLTQGPKLIDPRARLAPQRPVDVGVGSQNRAAADEATAVIQKKAV